MNERCNVSEQTLQEHLDQELDALSELVLTEHVRTCSHCRMRMASLQSLDQHLQKAMNTPLSLPAEGFDGLLAIILEQSTTSEAGGIGVKAYLRIQRGVLARTMGYLDYIPGSRSTRSALRRLGRESAGRSVSFLAGRLRAAAARG